MQWPMLCVRVCVYGGGEGRGQEEHPPGLEEHPGELQKQEHNTVHTTRGRGGGHRRGLFAPPSAPSCLDYPDWFARLHARTHDGHTGSHGRPCLQGGPTPQVLAGFRVQGTGNGGVRTHQPVSSLARSSAMLSSQVVRSCDVLKGGGAEADSWLQHAQHSALHQHPPAVGRSRTHWSGECCAGRASL